MLERPLDYFMEQMKQKRVETPFWKNGKEIFRASQNFLDLRVLI